jgi:hypothetical protein
MAKARFGSADNVCRQPTPAKLIFINFHIVGQLQN